MSLVIILPLLVCLLGLVIYFICLGLTTGTAGRVGEIMFFAGLLAFLLSGAQLGSCATVTAGGASGVHR
jgi:hypothetical protein